MPAVYRVLIYVFPFILGGMELLMRTLARTENPIEFLAPGVASASVTLLVPLLIPDDVPTAGLDAQLLEKLERDRLVLRSRRDERIVQAALVGMFIGIVVWCVLLFQAIGGRWPGWTPEVFLKIIQWPIAVAMLLYFVCAVVCDLKLRPKSR